MSRQVSYFIEGGDNVGKTTLIKHITQNFIRDYKKEFKEKSIDFRINKYPSMDNTEFMNVINDVLKLCEDENHNELYSRIKNLIINTMIRDMKDSFNNRMPYKEKDNWDYIDISDRGPLSTYLYNYTKNPRYSEIHNISNFMTKHFIPNCESKEESRFFNDFYKYIANLNIVILNNNLPDIPIISDKQEEIEYKKNFDNNTKLQQRINRQISNIVTAIDSEKDIDTITYPFKLHYINIYHDNGVRKTTEEVYEEFKKLIFNTIKEENNNE